jgi:hypothetical protein
LTSEKCYGTYDTHKAEFITCNKWGRYLTIQSNANGVELSVVEIAVHRRPIGKLRGKSFV